MNEPTPDDSAAPVDILYEQGPCLVVLKPGGLLTQAPPGIDSMETRLAQFLKQRDNKPGRIYLAVVHRLDRPVSGAIIFARHVRAARRLAAQFEGRIVWKKYLAVVQGRVEPEEGTWIDHLRKVPDEPRSEVVDASHPEGREAVLRYTVVRRREDGTLLEIELETGRTHQIRVQAASRGHPVWGDVQYGASAIFGPQTQDLRQRWIALHAWRLKFSHPMTRAPVEVEAPLPPAWQSFHPIEDDPRSS